MPRVCELVAIGAPVELTHPRRGRVLWRPVGNGAWALVYAEPPLATPDDQLVAGDEELLSAEWSAAPGG